MAMLGGPDLVAAFVLVLGAIWLAGVGLITLTDHVERRRADAFALRRRRALVSARSR